MRVDSRLRSRLGWAAVILACVALPATAATVATFADPAENAATPLFTVNVAAGTVTGGWPDSKTNLDLLLPVPGPNPPGTEIYHDAWFTMTDLTYTGTLALGTTGPGTIEFFADGTVSPVLFRITFQSATALFGGFGGDNILSSVDHVAFTGLETTNWISVKDESFAFSFANQVLIPNPGHPAAGYTASASLTASADVSIPEPAILTLLGIGLPAVMRRRRRS